MDARPTGKLIGYARVSTKDQELRMQLDDLKRAGCWNIYQEHASASKGRRRQQLELALLDLRPGDTLIVWKLDRLARNMRELYQLLDRIHAAGAGFKSLKENIDMATPLGRMLLGVFGALAQFEADLTAERTAAGMAALKKRGHLFGAKPKLSPSAAKTVCRLRKKGFTVARLAKSYGVSTGTINNTLKRMKTKRKGR